MHRRDLFFKMPQIAVGTNTLIGGIGATTTTASALATLLAISESTIKNFALSGNDIVCNITSDYAIPNGAFRDNSEITSYWDYEGMVTSIGSSGFGTNIVEEVGAQNLTHAYFPECTSIGNLCFAKGGLKKEVIYLPKCVAIGTSVTNQFCFWYDPKRPI